MHTRRRSPAIRNPRVAYHGRMPPDDEPLIRRVYAAFNARDIDAVLEHLDPDVDWPNAWEGGRVHGHAAVRDYWTRQWREIDPHVEPLAVRPTPDGRVEVDVHQTVRARDGTLIADNEVVHVYTIRGDRIVRMDVDDSAG
jgi:ketosteroid isomerase-like protein